MNCNLRRGLLSTLFAGGLLTFGATAASAADTTNGPDLSASAVVDANLGLSDGLPGSTDLAAAADINLGLGDSILGGTDGGLDSGVLDDVNVGLDACVIIGGGTEGCGTPVRKPPARTPQVRYLPR